MGYVTVPTPVGESHTGRYTRGIFLKRNTMGIENFFRRKPAVEKSEAQTDHDKKTTREAGMIGAAALAAAAGAGATYEKIPDLHATPNSVGKTIEMPAPAHSDLPGGLKIEKDSEGATVIHIPAEKGPDAKNVTLHEDTIHIDLDEHREHVDRIEQ